MVLRAFRLAGIASLIALALARLLYDFHGIVRAMIAAMMAGVAFYVAFLVVVDVPMYLGRWHADLASGKELLGLFAGLYDVGTRWVVTHEHQDHVNGFWRSNAPYFENFEIDNVWFAWTESPDDDLAKELRRRHKDQLLGLI